MVLAEDVTSSALQEALSWRIREKSPKLGIALLAAAAGQAGEAYLPTFATCRKLKFHKQRAATLS